MPECAAEGGTVKNNVGLFLQKRAQLNPGLEAFIVGSWKEARSRGCGRAKRVETRDYCCFARPSVAGRSSGSKTR